MKLNTKSYPIRIDNIDTDQIIPAQFLKQTVKKGLGKSLFFNWRYKSNGELNTKFILNKLKRDGGEIIIAGNNFGCGSSREHALWSLSDFGIKAVISSQFAEIFKNNAYYNGIIPIVLDKTEVETLMCYSEKFPKRTIKVDLKKQTVKVKEISFESSFEIDPFKKECMLQGIDEIQYLINLKSEIEKFELTR